MKLTIGLFLLLVGGQLFAQQSFVTSGKITFERKLSQFTLMESMQTEGETNFWQEEMKKVFPRIVTDTYVLQFDQNRSMYKLEKEISDNKYMVQNFKPMEGNYVLQDFANQTTTMRRNVFENEYQVKDSITQYNWKITGEVREIAGFECKKALTKINDSVVVVAFYTDQIIPRGGPENFNGLPGMILGLAIPRLALTLFATKIDVNSPVVIEKIAIKSKTFTRGQINKDIQRLIKDWGKEGKVIAWVTGL